MSSASLESDLRTALGLTQSETVGQDSRIHLQMCSVVKRAGYGEGIILVFY